MRVAFHNVPLTQYGPFSTVLRLGKRFCSSSGATLRNCRFPAFVFVFVFFLHDLAIWTLATAAETDFPIASRSAGLTLVWLYGPCSLRISQAHNREFIAVLRKAPISAAEVS